MDSSAYQVLENGGWLKTLMRLRTFASMLARWAIKNANINPLDIQMVLVATVTPDTFFPSTACYVQKGIGAKNAAAMDIFRCLRWVPLWTGSRRWDD